MKVEVIHAAFEDAPMTVALVEVGNVELMGETEALEYAFMRTNNIAGSWSRAEEFMFKGEVITNGDFSKDVEVLAELPVSERTGETMGLRSTSVGDIMKLNGKTFKVASFGFKEIV